MPDLTITASQVLAVAGAALETKLAAAAITAGKAVYLNASGTYALAQADGTALEATVAGIALNDAAIGQPVQIATSGDVNLGAGAAAVQGQVYVVATAAGGIAPYADLLTTNRVTIIGIGQGTNILRITRIVSGVAKP